MKNSRLAVLLVGVVAGLVVVHRASKSAQGVKLANNESYPLQIVLVSPQLSEDSTELMGATVTLRNTGNVPCVAFAASLVVTFSNSETRKMRWEEDRIALGYAKPFFPGDPISPNQIYTANRRGTVRLAAHEPSPVVGVEATLDYVEMADGKRYGADPARVGETMRMARWAHVIERKRLLNIYDSDGLQALLDELKRE